MPTIQLSILRGHHSPALAINQRIAATRLAANVTLATKSGWTAFQPGLIDTGAPVSVFPPTIWEQAKFSELGRVRIGGIARREECRIPAILARVTCALSDGAQTLGPIRMHAYLAEADDAPTIIGVLGFLERGLLRVALERNTAALRM